MKNAYFAQDAGLKIGLVPVDLNTAANTGERISLKEGHRVAIAIVMGDSTGAIVRPTLRQHDAASAGNSKDLSVDNAYFYKADGETSFTKVEPSVAAALFNLDSIFAAAGGVVVFEVEASQLDLENNYTHISVDIADSTAAKIGTVLYVLNSDNKPAHEIDL